MTKSDSLDNITLDSDDIQTIERFENNYYNHKTNILQNGGSNKLEKNIERLYNCYVLSQNQNGGDNNNELSSQIKTKLDKKIGELIVHNYDLEGGVTDENGQKIKNFLINNINASTPFIQKQLNIIDIKQKILDLLKTRNLDHDIKNILLYQIKPAIKDFIKELQLAKMYEEYTNKCRETAAIVAENRDTGYGPGLVKQKNRHGY
jgi:hypothetical protein